MESEFVQEGHIGHDDKSTTVEDGIYQDETKNGPMGKLTSCIRNVYFALFMFFSFISFLFSFLVDAEISGVRGKDDG